MNDLPLTDWYPCTIKPKRTGLYEVKRYRSNGEQLDQKTGHFDKKGYGNGWALAVIEQQDFWRGVAVDPETLK